MSDNQRQMIGLLIEASQIMDDLYWRQAYGDGYPEWLASIGVDESRFEDERARTIEALEAMAAADGSGFSASHP